MAEEAEENPRHVEIQRRMTELFRKLDALTNYHYAPKQPLPQLKVPFLSLLRPDLNLVPCLEIVKKLGSLGVEDGVSAEAAATAELLAPEEVAAPAALALKAKGSLCLPSFTYHYAPFPALQRRRVRRSGPGSGARRRSGSGRWR